MSARRIRILYVTGDFRLGGTQRQLLALLERLDRRRFEPAVACLCREGLLLSAVEATGAAIETFPLGPSLFHPASLRSLSALARRVRDFDLVHTLLGHANVLGLAACALARHPGAIASQRNLHPLYRSLRSGNRLLPLVADALFRRVARRIVANNPAIAASLQDRGVAADRIVVIPNGIDLDRFRPCDEKGSARESLGLPRGGPVVGFVGRMIPDKGLGRVVEAAARLSPRVPGLSLLAVGDGPDRSRCERAATAALGARRAVFTGPRSDPERMYPPMDLLAFPSTYSEGSPNVVLEAMACAVPVVAHRLPQTEAMIEHGRTGLLIDARDPGVLAEAMAGLLRDPDRAASIAGAARRFVERHHDLAETVRRTERLYESLAGTARESRCGRS